MDKIRFKIKKVILVILLIAAAFYAAFLYALPYVLNSNQVREYTENFLKEKTNLNLITENSYFKTHADLSVSINADKIYLTGSGEKPVFKTDNLSLFFDLKRLKLTHLFIDNVYADEYELRSIINSNPDKKKSSHSFKFNTSFVPDVNIKHAEIWVDRESINSIFIILDDINILKQRDKKVYCTFKADIISNMLKNLVHIGDKGCIYFDENGLYAKDMEIIVGFPHLTVDGLIVNKEKKSDFSLKGKALPVEDIEASLMYFLKLRKKGKQFLENFQNFSGKIDIDLKVKDWGFFGRCSAEDLHADSVLYNVPIVFKEVFFDFNDKEITSKATGTLGGEKVFNTFSLTGMATDEQEVTGHVNSFITNNLTSKYIPQIKVIGGADAAVDYRVKNHKINVDYLLKLNKNSEVVFNNSYLGIVDKDRRILVNTLKEEDKLYINHYEYSLLNGDKIQNVILGGGLLVKKDNRLMPEFITFKTNGYVPVTIAGSFGKLIEGGEFDGDLKYDFNKNLVTGDFTVKDTLYRNFYVENAKILADEKNVNIEAKGEFQNSPFNCRFVAENNFIDQIHIYKMDLFIKEILLNTKKSSAPAKINKKMVNTIKQKARDIDATIEQWIIKIDRIKRDKLEFNNILLTGSLDDNIFKFSMPRINFAKGELSADGVYNINNLSSEINFAAHNIDSNSVADIIFDLPNQIEGTADAELYAKTKNNFQEVEGFAKFKIEQGYLPTLGSTEFIVKKSKKVKREFKFKITDIINVDIKNMKALASDIEGSFYMTNEMIKDAKITSKQKYLSLLIEGCYDIDNRQADLNLYGKYNKTAEKKVKILFVPLSWIVNAIFRPEYTYDKYEQKLKEVPPIEADSGEEHNFRVKFTGDLNGDDINVEMKRVIKK